MGKKIRGSHLGWEATSAEKYAEKWWKEHGYAFELKKRYQSKSTYTVEKDGVTLDFDVFRADDDNKSVPCGPAQIKTFISNFEGLREVVTLRQQLKEKQKG